MATAKKPNPFAKFEKSGKDTEVKGKGKEGSAKEEKFDKVQMKAIATKPVANPMGFKKGGRKC